MKPCNVCGLPKPDDAFAKDKSREGGLALTCRECNKQRARQWYRDNKPSKKRKALEYKAGVAAGAIQPRPLEAPRPPREERARQEKFDQQPEDMQLVRFSAGEWLFVLQRADALGIKPGDYVRYLVRDARRRSQAGEPREGE